MEEKAKLTLPSAHILELGKLGPEAFKQGPFSTTMAFISCSAAISVSEEMLFGVLALKLSIPESSGIIWYLE